jgi:hypothetical protein
MPTLRSVGCRPNEEVAAVWSYAASEDFIVLVGLESERLEL